MQRSSIIAAVVAASGILVASSVASVAVINAASSNAVVAGDVTLVATPVALPSEVTPTPEAVEATPTAEPTLDPIDVGGEDLPAIPSVSPRAKNSTSKSTAQAPRTQARPAAKPVARKPAAKPVAKKPVAKPVAKKPAAKPVAKPAAPEISGDQARDIVLASTGGGLTRSVAHVDHNGFTAWAVQVTRHDTSTVTGWVEVHSGTIFDWHVDSPANPTPSPAGGGGPTPRPSTGDNHGGGGHGSDD